MTYSSAFWGAHQDLSLTSAQLNKYEQLLNALKAKPGDHILEIGCGWGGFLEYAGSKGHRVTGVTISKEQFDYAVKRIDQAGLSKNVEILFVDYRDIVGVYDHVVSIEMIEAVGQSYWPLYFKKIREVVRPGGSVAIQGITIHDKVFESYKKGTDFIQQYIFPGGMLPCEKEIKRNIESINSSQLDFTRFGQDYARTLKIWAENFSSQKDNIESLGYSLEFQRMWLFYLKYCEGAFRAGQINVVLVSYSV
jgi:cyclopropane-fatty-acyl-phospholipid synthase